MPVAGPLREYVVIQTNTPTRTEWGGTDDSWATAATVNASVKPLRGGEFWAAQQVQSEVTHIFRMRYTAYAVANNRITWSGRTFEILSVLNSDPAYLGAERNTFVDVQTKELTT